MLVLPSAIREPILEHAREAAPHECCGVLGGAFGATGRSRVRSRYPAENVADTPRTRYRIDPAEQFEIFERLEARGEEIVGFYHSHPRGPPSPSDTDAENAFWSDRSYVIVSLEPLDVGSWRWRKSEGGSDGRFEREELALE